MKKQIWFIAFIALAFVTSCGRFSDQKPTPTPFSNDNSAQFVGDSKPVPVGIASLTGNPALYEGAYVEVEGIYQRLPLVVCGADPHLAPSSWSLSSGEEMIAAGGEETSIRRLLNDGTVLTVAGHWRYWRDLVGCGKRAEMREIWYLDVDRIISPNPIAKTETGEINPLPTAPLGPPDAPPTETLPSPLKTATSPSTPNALPTERPTDIVQPTAEATAVSSATSTTAALPTATSENSPTPTASVTAASTPNPNATATSTSTAATLTAVATAPSSKTVTPTPAGGATATPSNSATATPTPGTITWQPISKGALELEDPVTGQLNAGEMHQWTLTLTDDDTLIAYAVAGENANAIITVVNSDTNAVIVEQNQAGAEETEALTVDLPAGNYYVNVADAAGDATDYVSLFTLSDPVLELKLNGLLAYNDSATESLVIDNDHYWVFVGSSGDDISITVSPNDNSNLFIELLGQSNFVDETGNGESEALLNFTLDTSGLQIIWIGESDFAEADYTVTLVKNN